MALSMEGVSLRETRAVALVQGAAMQRYDGGRSCAHPSCVTRLSTYNPSEVCGAHNGWRADVTPRRRRRAVPAPD
jgi:hypothetical protein